MSVTEVAEVTDSLTSCDLRVFCSGRCGWPSGRPITWAQSQLLGRPWGRPHRPLLERLCSQPLGRSHSQPHRPLLWQPQATGPGNHLSSCQCSGPWSFLPLRRQAPRGSLPLGRGQGHSRPLTFPPQRPLLQDSIMCIFGKSHGQRQVTGKKTKKSQPHDLSMISTKNTLIES